MKQLTDGQAGAMVPYRLQDIPHRPQDHEVVDADPAQQARPKRTVQKFTKAGAKHMRTEWEAGVNRDGEPCRTCRVLCVDGRAWDVEVGVAGVLGLHIHITPSDYSEGARISVFGLRHAFGAEALALKLARQL